VFSIYGQESDTLAPSPNATNPIEFLRGLADLRGEQLSYAIAGVEVKGWDQMVTALHEEADRVGATYRMVPGYKSGAALTNQMGAKAQEAALQEAADLEPDALVLIGNAQDTLQNALTYFADVKKPHNKNTTGYSPPAAFFMGGLAAMPTLQRESYNYLHREYQQASRSEEEKQWVNCHQKGCWSYDQWMGFVPWTADMPHAGPTQWPTGLRNPYAMKPDHSDFKYSMKHRYLGSAEYFAEEAQTYVRDACKTSCRERQPPCDPSKSCDHLEPTYYHAKAAASLLLFQMSIELSNDHDGYGMTLDDVQTVETLTSALSTMNGSLGIETFWGPIDLGALPTMNGPPGYNTKYEIGIGQFQKNRTAPTLVSFRGKTLMQKPDVDGKSSPDTPLVEFPATWPDWCLINGPNGIGGVCPPWYLHEDEFLLYGGLTVAVVVLVCACCGFFCCWRKRESKRTTANLELETRLWNASVLGDQSAPDVQLRELDIPTRWAYIRGLEAQPTSHDTTGEASTRRVIMKGSRTTHVPKMFGDMRELQPSNWQKDSSGCRLGGGTYGNVYRAEWVHQGRRRKVAVKVIKLPEELQNTAAEARDKFKEKVRKVNMAFVREVDVCCELCHPNLVDTLGYATTGGLYIVQELLEGGSLDHWLWKEHWRPDESQMLQAALDIAKGMAHLHTHFFTAAAAVSDTSSNAGGAGGSGRSSRSVRSRYENRPIIHHDLKSPNILLDRSPLEHQEGVVMKIADFGLARDKELVGDSNGVAMSGVRGSLLWIAPEVFSGDPFDEKVDVYSYAMTLVELHDASKPWETAGIRGPSEVPHRVVNGERPKSQIQRATPDMRKLIEGCWAQAPRDRPAFPDIVTTLEELRVMREAEASASDAPSDDGGDGGDEAHAARVLEAHVRRSMAGHIDTTVHVDPPEMFQPEPEPEPEPETGSTRIIM